MGGGSLSKATDQLHDPPIPKGKLIRHGEHTYARLPHPHLRWSAPLKLSPLGDTWTTWLDDRFP